MTQGFIEQTAFDYDMEVSEVERIAKTYPDEFYEKLEAFILDRANSSN